MLNILLIPGVPHVRWSWQAVQLYVSKHHAVSTEDVNMRSLVYGQLLTLGECLWRKFTYWWVFEITCKTVKKLNRKGNWLLMKSTIQYIAIQICLHTSLYSQNDINSQIFTDFGIRILEYIYVHSSSLIELISIYLLILI